MEIDAKPKAIRMLGCKQQDDRHREARLACDINASDLACLLGCGYDSPRTLFAKKKCRLPANQKPESNQYLLKIMQKGQELEPIALQRLSGFINKKVEPGYMWMRDHDGISFGATPDVRC
jgi:hypothetical protein